MKPEDPRQAMFLSFFFFFECSFPVEQGIGLGLLATLPVSPLTLFSFSFTAHNDIRTAWWKPPLLFLSLKPFEETRGSSLPPHQKKQKENSDSGQCVFFPPQNIFTYSPIKCPPLEHFRFSDENCSLIKPRQILSEAPPMCHTSTANHSVLLFAADL